VTLVTEKVQRLLPKEALKACRESSWGAGERKRGGGGEGVSDRKVGCTVRKLWGSRAQDYQSL
jgi:hypothetical protein